LQLVFYLNKYNMKLRSASGSFKTGYCLLAVFVFVIFSMTGCSEKEDIKPRLNTIAAANADITATSAILKGEITSLGNMNIIEYGVELSANQLFNPYSTKSLTTPAPAVGTYQVEFTGLTPNTLYYYRAYVLINTARVYSQNLEHFTTKNAVK
jgi:hypothetical protein